MQRLCTRDHELIRGDLSGAATPLSCTVNNQTGPLVEQGPGVWRGCRSTRANEAANGARRRGALRSNAWRDWTEVSRGRTSRHPHAKKGNGKGPNTNGQGGAVTDSILATNPTGGAEDRGWVLQPALADVLM